MIDEQWLGRGAAASVVIFLCIALLVIVYTRLVRVEEAYMAEATAPGPNRDDDDFGYAAFDPGKSSTGRSSGFWSSSSSCTPCSRSSGR